MEQGSCARWKDIRREGQEGRGDILPTSPGNAAAKIGFDLFVEAFYFKFHEVRAMTPVSLEG